MQCFMSKKVSLPKNANLKTLAWNKKQGYIACGGDKGLLKVLRMGARKALYLGGSGKESENSNDNTSSLQTNQTLEGHSGEITFVQWNEPYHKLTTCDTNGFIIVWMEHKGVMVKEKSFPGAWYEEMVNNRQKSVVKGMAWSYDGQKICIAYDDGVTIVGSVDGNRLWGKELKGFNFLCVEWSPDAKLLLFGSKTGEVHIYEYGGAFVGKLPLSIEKSDKDCVMFISWFKQQKDPDVPSLVVAFGSGPMQLMTGVNDNNPICVNTDLEINSLEWNPQGNILAVNGLKFIFSEEHNEKETQVKFYSPFGELLYVLRSIICVSGVTWEGDGLRIALAVDNLLYFATVRPSYKFCYFSNTLAYAFAKAESKRENALMFLNTSTKEKHLTFVKPILSITAFGDFCCTATKSEDSPREYILTVCNSIGSPIDSCIIEMQPLYLAMNNTHVYAASKDTFCQFAFISPKSKVLMDFSEENASDQKFKEEQKLQFFRKESIEAISCITCSRCCLVLAIKNSSCEFYAIPRVIRFQLEIKEFGIITKMAFNCIASLLSCINIYGEIAIFDASDGPSESTTSAKILHDHSIPIQNENSYIKTSNLQMKEKESSKFEADSLSPSSISVTSILSDTVSRPTSFIDSYDFDNEKSLKPYPIDRKFAWDIIWASDDPYLYALMDKNRMYIYKRSEPEEPISCLGYMYEFRNLEVKSVFFPDLLEKAEDPNIDHLIITEIKALRDTKDLIDKVGLKDAVDFAEEYHHFRLWKIIAIAAMKKKDLKAAEQAFVRIADYPGIQFVKSLLEIQNEIAREAEIEAYLGDIDNAQKLYLDEEEITLAVELHRLFGNWFRVFDLLKTYDLEVSEMEEAWNGLGDYYYDRQQWNLARKCYEKSNNEERIAVCSFILEDYSALINLEKNLLENHPLLIDLASMFANVGMCDFAVNAYLKANQPESALECCQSLNQWKMAISLASTYGSKNLSSLLSNYNLFLENEKSIFTVIEVYKKTNKFLHAAFTLFKFAKTLPIKKVDPLILKKLHVLIGLLIEEYKANRKLIKFDEVDVIKLGATLEKEATFQKEAPNLIDDPWRGAKAYHFLMLTQKHLYQGYMDAAMKTALHLRDYEDILDVEVIYSLLALASCANRSFGTCSSAFMKLESLEQLEPEEREKYKILAAEIFTKHPPVDHRCNLITCRYCHERIPDMYTTCPKCDTTFPVCVASGQPIMTRSQQWLCDQCHNFAFKQEMLKKINCALCHSFALSRV